MFGILKTLVAGSTARAEDRLKDVYAIELIDQKIREAQGSLKAAKATLAALIQRQRAETRQIEALQTRITDLTTRATDALAADREDLAQEAAQAIAHMENELTLRRDTQNGLDAKVLRLRQSIENANRRIIDLKQGAVMARAVRREQDSQARLNATIADQSSFEDAEDLISRVLSRDDPFEQGEILKEIDDGLNHGSIGDKMAASGFGPATKTTAADVLARLRK